MVCLMSAFGLSLLLPLLKLTLEPHISLTTSWWYFIDQHFSSRLLTQQLFPLACLVFRFVKHAGIVFSLSFCLRLRRILIDIHFHTLPFPFPFAGQWTSASSNPSFPLLPKRTTVCAGTSHSFPSHFFELLPSNRTPTYSCDAILAACFRLIAENFEVR